MHARPRRTRRLAPALALVAGTALIACSNPDTPRTQLDSETNARAGMPPAQAAAVANAEIAVKVREALGESADAPTLVIYKTPTCGCCDYWVDHVEDAGFDLEVHDVGHHELAIKRFEHGLASDLHSCHSTVVDGYLVEGHVPADAIAKLLHERPEIAGIAVPGMPMGSPGMEGHRVDPYDVIAYDRDGNRSVFASY